MGENAMEIDKPMDDKPTEDKNKPCEDKMEDTPAPVYPRASTILIETRRRRKRKHCVFVDRDPGMPPPSAVPYKTTITPAAKTPDVPTPASPQVEPSPKKQKTAPTENKQKAAKAAPKKAATPTKVPTPTLKAATPVKKAETPTKVATPTPTAATPKATTPITKVTTPVKKATTPTLKATPTKAPEKKAPVEKKTPNEKKTPTEKAATPTEKAPVEKKAPAEKAPKPLPTGPVRAMVVTIAPARTPAPAPQETAEPAPEAPPVDVKRNAVAAPPKPELGALGNTVSLYRETSAAAAMRGQKSVLSKMNDQLKGGKFRWLNEQMYTTTSEESVDLFKDDPALFADYHEGYREQVVKWPENPLDVIARQIKGKVHSRKTKAKRTIVADVGCGDGNLARLLFNEAEVHSYDLVAVAKHIVVCDITKHIPLPSNSCDFVVSCLALMGTNWPETVNEAQRILVIGGVFKIAEVTSRLSAREEDFMSLLRSKGFSPTIHKKASNTHFTLIDCVKTSAPKYDARLKYTMQNEAGAILTPCLYKKR